MERLYLLGLVYSLTLTVIYGAGQLNLGLMMIFSNVFFPATACAVAALSFLTLERYVGHNPKPMFSASWVSFSSGIMLFFIGEIMWAVHVILHVKSYPSIVDVFFLGGYFLLFQAFLLVLRLFKPSLSRTKVAVSAGASAVLALATCQLLLVPMFNSSKDIMATALVTSYVIFDIAFFSFALLLSLVFLGGSLEKSWLFITSGVILKVSADLFFHNAEFRGFYYQGHPFELLWLWGYMAVMIGLLVHMREF